VAQVFKAKMKNKDSSKDVDVAIKMIHPHVEELVKTDMELLSHIAHLIDKFPALEILSIGETLRQFADAMNSQLDLRFEANNLVKFAKKFSTDKWVLFPSPIGLQILFSYYFLLLFIMLNSYYKF
jgi:aarF domain-containing kinase